MLVPATAKADRKSCASSLMWQNLRAFCQLTLLLLQNLMRHLFILSPIQQERDAIVRYCAAQGLRQEDSNIGQVPVVHIPELHLTLARGGLGKVQFAVTTRYILDMGSCPDVVLCAGAAGGLVDDVAIGDVVIGTTAIEHDFRKKFGRRRPPAYAAAPRILEALQSIQPPTPACNLHVGPIASGDEDIADPARRRAVHELTGALAVAWEGIGGARACAFSNVPFVEIRGITDAAAGDVPSSFKANLQLAMTHVAAVILTLAQPN